MPQSDKHPTPLAVLAANDYRIDMLTKRVPEVLEVPAEHHRTLVSCAIRHPLVVSAVTAMMIAFIILGIWALAPVLFGLESQVHGRGLAVSAAVVVTPLMLGVLVALVPLATFLQIHVLRKLIRQYQKTGVAPDFARIAASGNTAFIIVGLVVLVLGSILFAIFMVMD